MAFSASSKEILDTLTNLQTVLDIYDKDFQKLIKNPPKSFSTELRDQEIHTYQGKFLKIFSKQISLRRRIPVDQWPSEFYTFADLHQWLTVIDIQPNLAVSISSNFESLEELLKLPDVQILKRSLKCGIGERDYAKLIAAVRELRSHLDRQKSSSEELLSDTVSVNSPSANSPDPYVNNRASLPDELPHFNSRMPISSSPLLKDPSAVSSSTSDIPIQRQAPQVFFNDPSYADGVSVDHLYRSDPLRRSLSLGSKSLIVCPLNSEILSARSIGRLSDEDMGYTSQSSAERSPAPHATLLTKFGQINHQFKSRTFLATCDFCRKWFAAGVRCIECRVKCHKSCTIKFPKNCHPLSHPGSYPYDKLGSNPNILGPRSQSGENIYQKPFGVDRQMFGRLKGSNTWHNKGDNKLDRGKIFNHNHFNASTSSSSPNGLVVSSSGYSSADRSNYPESVASSSVSSATSSPSRFKSPADQKTFNFPDRNRDDSDLASSVGTLEDDIVVSDNTAATLTDSEKTLPGILPGMSSFLSSFDNIDSKSGEKTSALGELEIPFEQITCISPVGAGRFGTVFKGQWHGDVAIKLFELDPEDSNDNQQQMEDFLCDVAILKNTRHINLSLFMGACIRPSALAIVTGFCRGKTLYQKLHVRRETLDIKDLIMVAKQIAQAVGYLHARAIIHKDLRAKNVYVDERFNVTICDYGLMNVTKIAFNKHCQEHRILLYSGWLTYLAPEIIQKLQPIKNIDRHLPFTFESDVYAFGTICYEMLSCEIPFRRLSPEQIIWRLGNGVVPAYSSFQTSREFKSIVKNCWSFQPEERPFFSDIIKQLGNVPVGRYRTHSCNTLSNECIF